MLFFFRILATYLTKTMMTHLPPITGMMTIMILAVNRRRTVCLMILILWFKTMMMMMILMMVQSNKIHLDAIEARTAAMERSVLELERFSREAAVLLRNSRRAESRSVRGRD